MKVRKWVPLALVLLGCGGDVESYSLSVVVKTVVPPQTRFVSVSTEIYTADDDTTAIASDEYVSSEADDFRAAGVRIIETTLEEGVYRVVTSLLSENGSTVASESQWLTLSSDYELSLQLGRELCNPYDTPLLTSEAALAACQGKTWFECSQAADLLCTAQSELNTEACWIGGVGYVEDGSSVRVICLGYAGAVRMTESLDTLSSALGASGSTSPLTAESVTSRRGAQAVNERCIGRGFGGGVGPVLVDSQQDVHFLCIDRDLVTVEDAALGFFDADCSYSTMPESQACTAAASTLCRRFDHEIGFGPTTAPEESAGAIEALCF